MMTKRTVFVIGLVGTVILTVLTVLSITEFCYFNKTCLTVFEKLSPWSLANYIFFTPPIFLLSLITYRMKDEVFRAWWGFARWWVPVIIVVTLLLENAGGGGTLGMNKDFTAFILIILYSIFGIVSLVKIVRTYLKTR